ncbi:MAG: DUF4412 domain-containing protein [Rhodovarius sp.]|nr:DUF4412 domain-containing protein [Rhodovarius sp.]MCX7931277.1 DUF4412 domain-containing protein [Rhodovarius sp.]
MDKAQARRRRRRESRAVAAAAAVLALAASCPAMAEERPPHLWPLRDVRVEYRMSAAGEVRRLVLSWLAERRLTRTETAEGYAVMDHRAGRGFLALPGERTVVEITLPAGTAGGLLRPPPEARFTRLGSARIAGLACTRWRVEEPGGARELCLTADGVALRAAGGRGSAAAVLEAERVDYAAQDPARFDRPAGFRSLTAASSPPGLGLPQGPAASEGPPPPDPAAGQTGLPLRGRALPPPGLP